MTSTMGRQPGWHHLGGKDTKYSYIQGSGCLGTLSLPWRNGFLSAERLHLLKVIKMILVAGGGPEGARLSSSPSALQSPAYSQVHSWHCSGRECREGADPLSMGKMSVCVRERRCK